MDSMCEGCGKPIGRDEPALLGECDLCADCAPTFEDMRDDDSGAWISHATGEAMTRAERLAWFDKHIAAGGNPTDSTALD